MERNFCDLKGKFSELTDSEFDGMAHVGRMEWSKMIARNIEDFDRSETLPSSSSQFWIVPVGKPYRNILDVWRIVSILRLEQDERWTEPTSAMWVVAPKHACVHEKLSPDQLTKLGICATAVEMNH